MKKLLLLLSLLFLSGCSNQLGATRTFVSNQVGESPAAGRILQTNGATSTWVTTSSLGIVGGSGSSTVLQTNGTPNGSQALLNLKNGTNVTISDDGVGGVTINSSGSGGGSTTTLTNTQVAFGGADNLVTSSPSLTYNTSTNRLILTGTVSSTNGLFLSVTTTRLGVGSDTVTDITGTGLEISAGSLQLTTPYQDGSAFDSRFVNVTGGDSMEGRLTISGGSPGGLYIYSETEDTPSANGVYAGYSPDGTGRTKIELSGGTESYIDFTDTGLDFEGRIHYDQATNVLSFFANGQQTMSIDDTSLYATSTNFGLIIMGGDSVNDFTGLNLEVVGNALSVVTNPTFATTTITGGFSQTDFSDCDNGVTSKVLYDSATLKFSCGTDQTGGGGLTVTAGLVVFGDTDGTATTSANFTFETSTATLGVTRILASNLQTNTITTTKIRASGVSLDFGATDNASLNFSGITNIITPAIDNVTDLGSSGLRFDDVYLYDLFGYNVTTTNLSVTGTLAGLYGTFASITSTNSAFATTSITGGLFQTGLGDCAGANQGLNYTVSTGKLGCVTFSSSGSPSLTNTLIAFGNTDNTITSSTALSFNTTTNSLILTGTVSSTNALFFNATSTNFFATNGNFTRATSTQFFGTNGVFTSVTSTNLRVSGVTSLAGLSFTNATGTGQFLIATTTITGGLFQTGMSTCNADNQTLGYNATTGKFECGDDDTTSPVVSTTNANTWSFTDISPAAMVDNNTTEIFNDTTRPNIQPQSVNNSVLVTLDFQVIGGGANDTDVAVRVVRENDPGSTTPTCDLTSDYQVGSSIVGGSLATAFLTNATDIQTARLSVVDSPATTTPVYYTVCSSVSSTLGSAPGSRALHVSLTEIQGSGGGTAREYTRIVTSTGSSAWTKPVTSTGFVGAYVWCVAGGGGGGGAGTNSTIGGGGAGGGGSYIYLSASDLSATSSVNVTVGAGGAGGTAGNNNGVAGGTSSFSTFITCTGGALGVAGNAAETTAAGGAGSGGNVNGTGGAGGPNGAYTDSWRGYGGAACVNQNWPSTIQDAFSPNVTPGGILGQWCGAGAARPPSWSATNYTGGQGASFGAGGSGGQRTSVDAAGGAGRQGVVVIIEQFQ